MDLLTLVQSAAPASATPKEPAPAAAKQAPPTDSAEPSGDEADADGAPRRRISPEVDTNNVLKTPRSSRQRGRKEDPDFV
jgi:hypothetical protein